MTATPLTLFEHETADFNWTDRDVALLERLRISLRVPILSPTLSQGNRALKAAQHVGVVRFGQHTVQILPKMYRSADPKTRPREATRNLLHMLAIAGRLTVREHQLAPLLQRDLDWFELLTRLFATHLIEEWQRGACRSYQVVTDDLPVLKGKWRTADQFRRFERKHIFAVAYDEFSADNELNRVFRFVVERLWLVTRDGDNRRLLGELRQWLDEVTLLPSLIAAQAPASLITRLNQRFEPHLNLARLFLDGSSLQMTAGDFRTFSFVFDMNELFEAFVVSLIRRHRADILSPALAGCSLLPQSTGATLHLAQAGNKPAFRLRPDLVISRPGGLPPPSLEKMSGLHCQVRKEDEYTVLLDTKYKQLDLTTDVPRFSENDFYQMYAYARRYNCARVVIVFPEMSDGEGLKGPFEFKIHGGGSVIVTTVDLRDEISKPPVLKAIASRLKSALNREEIDGSTSSGLESQVAGLASPQSEDDASRTPTPAGGVRQSISQGEAG